MTQALLELPGLIDCHVHFREPGFPDKATMKSESGAAKAGGVLTVCDMPNCIPPTVTVEAFRDKVDRAKKISDVDILFFFGVTCSKDLEELHKITEYPELKERMCGVKIFFDHSTGDQGADDETIECAFKYCSEIDVSLVAHCEDKDINNEASKMIEEAHPGMEDTSLHSLMRPCASEAKAIERAIGLAKKYRTQFHIAHVSTAQGIDLIRKAKIEGVNVTCEVTPHHLFLTVDDYETLGPFAKMNPPLRTASEQQALWEGIADGTVDCISSDHAPHTLKEKQCANPLDAPSGVTGVETMLPLLLTVASGHWPNPNSIMPDIPVFQYSNIPALCFSNPNKIFRLGKSAEPRVFVDSDEEWIIKGSELHYKCRWTPYENWKVMGKIV